MARLPKIVVPNQRGQVGTTPTIPLQSWGSCLTRNLHDYNLLYGTFHNKIWQDFDHLNTPIERTYPTYIQSRKINQKFNRGTAANNFCV